MNFFGPVCHWRPIVNILSFSFFKSKVRKQNSIAAIKLISFFFNAKLNRKNYINPFQPPLALLLEGLALAALLLCEREAS